MLMGEPGLDRLLDQSLLMFLGVMGLFSPSVYLVVGLRSLRFVSC
jgi:hypothetical protein